METTNLFGTEVVDIRHLLATGPRVVARRLVEAIASGTLHYNGPATWIALNQAAEIAHLKSIASYHRNKVWGYNRDGSPIYGDGAMYQLAVGGTGTIYWLRDLEDCLWHCGNTKGNNTSLAVHLPIGVGQAPTAEQWASAGRLFDAAGQHLGFGRRAVFGHREWPRTGGGSQSECPGSVLMPMLKSWRNESPAPASTQLVEYRITFDNAYIREAPTRNSSIALQGHGILEAGYTFLSDVVVAGQAVGGKANWIHMDNGWGFVHESLAERTGKVVGR